MSDDTRAYVRWSLEDGVAVVEVLARELNNPTLARGFGNELGELLARGLSDRVLVDFRNTRYMSSTAFGELLVFVKAAKAAGVRVAVCGMDPAVRMGADFLSLPQFIPICADESAGLAALAAGGPP